MNAAAAPRWAGLAVVAASLACASCGGDPGPRRAYTYPVGVLNALAIAPEPVPGEEDLPPADELERDPALAPANGEPELTRRDVPHAVIAGRAVHFGLDALDPEGDPVRVELASHPEGVTLDPRTLTARWQVPRGARGEQRFVVRLTERPGEANERVVERPFEVVVVPRAPLPGAPEIAAPYVPTLVTVTAPDYLARVAGEWPVERALEVARDGAIDALPADEQRSVERRAGRELFRDLLAEFARVHDAPRIDPSSPRFDRRFEAARWRLVAVRPRVDEAVEGLDLAYQAVDVPEPVFARFRFRLFRGAAPAPAELVRANNAAFTRLVHGAFFDGARPRPGIAEGRGPAVRDAVAALVRAVLTFRDPRDPRLRVALAAIHLDARLGGGSAFDADGRYLHGNAWAWSLANVAVDPAPPAGAPGGTRRAARVVRVAAPSLEPEVAPAADGAREDGYEGCRVGGGDLPVGSAVRSPWLARCESAQVCDLGRKIREHVGVPVDLPCPSAP